MRMKHIARLVALAAALLMGLIANPSLAAKLKSEVTVYANTVYAKDLFDNAGEHGNEPLFLAPDLGQSGRISAHRVASEAHQVGLYDVRLDGIETVIVHRPSQKIARDDVRSELKDKISDLLRDDIDFEITTTSIPALTHADPRVSEPMAIDSLRLLNANSQFQAMVKIKTHRGETFLPVRGTITQMRQVAVLTRDMRRDDVLQPGDIEEKRIAKKRIRSGTITAVNGLIGKALTRNLNASDALREQDITDPLLIRNNDRVSITYVVPGLILTAQGRALDAGALDETISVMNLQSNRVIRGRVTDTGEVIVEARKSLFANHIQNQDQEVQ